jgi:flagellar motor switch protein FliG
LSDRFSKNWMGTIRTRHNNGEITSLKEGLVIGRVTQGEYSHRRAPTALLQNLKRSTLADICAKEMPHTVALNHSETKPVGEFWQPLPS